MPKTPKPEKPKDFVLTTDEVIGIRRCNKKIDEIFSKIIEDFEQMVIDLKSQ